MYYIYIYIYIYDVVLVFFIVNFEQVNVSWETFVKFGG